MKFTELNLNENLLEAISHMGFENATPIQEFAIPKILENKDIIGDFGDRSYWSSSTKKGITRFIFSNSFFVDFKRGSCFEISQDRDLYVRPVKNK